MTLRARLLAIVLLSLAMVSFLIAAVVHGYRTIERKSAMADAAAEQFISLQLALRGLHETVLTEGTAAPRRLVAENMRNFARTWPTLITQSDDPAQQVQLTSVLQPRWREFRDGVDSFLAIRLPGPDNDEAMIAFGRLISQAELLSRELDELRVAARASADDEAERLRSLATAGVVFMTFALLATFVWAYRGIMRPISSLVGRRSSRMTRSAPWPGASTSYSNRSRIASSAWRRTAMSWRTKSSCAPPSCARPRRPPKPPAAPRASSWPP
jgi:cbb3-type cytochrome oxidase subunit 3